MKKTTITFDFYGILSVTLAGNVNSRAARRFVRRYKHYLSEKQTARAPDVTIDFSPPEVATESTYLFNHYRVSRNLLTVKNRYKISHWVSQISPYGQFPCLVRLDGNLPAQISMVDFTLGYWLIWFLSLKGYMPIHAGAVSKGGEGTLLAGRRGVGKTMLVGRLLERGYKMVSEDRVFLNDGVIHGFRLPANIKYDRKDPGIARLPFRVKARTLRNRLLSVLTMNYLTLLEPVPLETLLPGKLIDSARASRLLYLQSGPTFSVESVDDKRTISEQIVRGNMLDFLKLRQEQTAYNYAFPGSGDGNNWEKCREETYDEIKNLEVQKVTVPTNPSALQWNQLVELIES